MVRGFLRCFVALTVTLAGLATAGAGAAHAEDYPEVTVTMTDNSFGPARLTIDPGTVVRWQNDGRNDHNVIADGKGGFTSKTIKRGKSYEHEFEKPGVFGYSCTFHGAPHHGMYGTIIVRNADGSLPKGADAVFRGSSKSSRSGKPATIRVPKDRKTIQAAVDVAKPGDLVLVSPGVYKEAVTVTTDRIVIRGLDRNKTIVDGQFKRQNGFKVLGASGVAIENITARNFTGNGFFWTGTKGYRGSYLTAYRNGDYGVYAFDSVDGRFDHSYASGSPDSGFYVGQCNPCNAVLTDLVSEYNELGYSGTNAGGNLYIVDSVWRNNRAGIVPNTLDSETMPPQRDLVIAANLVANNGDPKAVRSKTAEFDAVFGVGIAIVGGVNDLVTKNTVVGNTVGGIAIAPNPAIQKNFWPAKDNKIVDNVVRRSGRADLAIAIPTADDGNCFADNEFTTTAPAKLEQLKPCQGAGVGDPNEGALDLQEFLDTSKHPKGLSYKKAPAPPKQHNMPHAKTAKARPATGMPGIKVDVDKLKAPKAPRR
jgi:plastocyanin